ncbi:MAG TPA: hypothetical protein VK421_08500 [Pyrinomonadaceae bacterium]|nr:hypothetical protein [Pyrinomonadaceae bacterium]
MYCSSCGSPVAQDLSYCHRCGAKANGAKGDAAVKSSGVRPETLAAFMVLLFVFGLGVIAMLTGAMKVLAGFDLPVVLALTLLSFVLLFVVEGVLIGLLLKGRRGNEEAGDAGRLGEQTTEVLGEAQARVLPDPVPSVTEHTTRSFEPIHSERQSE